MKSLKTCFFFLSLSVLILAGCRHAHLAKSASFNAAAAPDYAAQGYVQATVTLYDVDGCKWLITLADGKRLIPSPGLAEAFAVDGLKIRLKYSVKKGAVGTCMAGTIVEISAIEKSTK
jgi:hypothetical protein